MTQAMTQGYDAGYDAYRKGYEAGEGWNDTTQASTTSAMSDLGQEYNSGDRKGVDDITRAVDGGMPCKAHSRDLNTIVTAISPNLDHFDLDYPNLDHLDLDHPNLDHPNLDHPNLDHRTPLEQRTL